MKKKIISIAIVVILAFSLMGTNVFVVDTKAVPSGKGIDKVVDALKSSVEKYHRTHKKDKNGDRIQINEDFQKTKSGKKRNSLPSSYMAPYTSVKDQASFGSCWMFAGVSSLESSLLVKANNSGGLVSTDSVDFSEAQGVYVQYNRDTADGTISGTALPYSANDVEKHSDDYYGYGEGGWPFDATMALTADKGAALESDNPYISNSSSSKSSDSRTMAGVAAAQYKLNRFNIESAEALPEIFAVTNRTRVYNPNARDVWKNKIIENGAISANYYHISVDRFFHCWGKNEDDYEPNTEPNFWFFSANKNNKYSTNHVITVVGFDDNYSKYNFVQRKETYKYDEEVAEIVYIKEDESGNPKITFDDNGHLVSADVKTTATTGYEAYVVPKEDGAWHIKNSYGTQMDGKKVFDDGIMHMSYCEETLSEAISSVVEEDIDQINNHEKVYDTTLTHSSMMGDVLNGLGDNAKASEIYTVDKALEINQVGYWTGIEDTTTRIKIYQSLSDTTNPESGTLVYDSNNITDARYGYHTATLTDGIEVERNDTVSVVISQECDGESAIMLETDYLDQSRADYFFNSNRGDTYIYTEDEVWVDSKDVDEEASATGITVGNSTVKLFGNTTEEPETTTPKTYTVSVDGVETTVNEGDNFVFPNTSVNGYVKNDYSVLYAPGQSINVRSNITAKSIPQISFEMLKGASIRKEGDDGIRFIASASCDDEEILDMDCVETGTLITSEDMFIDNFDEELTLETYDKYMAHPSSSGIIYKIVNSGWLSNQVGKFSAGIVKVKQENWNRYLLSQGYMTFNYSNNTQKTIYAGVSVSRSIVYVAKGIRDSGYQGCTEEEITRINNYIEHGE